MFSVKVQDRQYEVATDSPGQAVKLAVEAYLSAGGEFAPAMFDDQQDPQPGRLALEIVIMPAQKVRRVK